MSRAKIIGYTAADLVRRELTLHGAAAPSKRSALVRTLDRDEVLSLVDALADLRMEGCSQDVEVVVSVDPVRRSTDTQLSALASNHPLTYYRNRASRGLVLIELDPFSDGSGQSHFRTFTDRDLLGTASDRVSRDRLLANAWSLLQPDSVGPPQVLTERLERLATALLSTEIALRPWVAFIEHLVTTAPAGVVITAERAEQLIATALPQLRLFADPELFSHSNIVRELGKNRHLAQLRDPNGRELDQEDWLQRIESADLTDETRAAATEYIRSDSVENRQRAPTYREWARLFESRARRGLGQQIRAELDSVAEQRLDELGIVNDLDERDREAAQILLADDQDVGDGRNLAELIPPAIRRRLERLAAPGMTVIDEPLRGLLKAVMSLASERQSSFTVEALDPEPPRGTLHVFAVLYGATLKSIAAEVPDHFAIAPSLCNPAGLPDLAGVGGDAIEPETADEPWSELRLKVSTADGESTVLSWSPRDLAGYALLARLIADPEATSWPLAFDDFDNVLGEALSVPMQQSQSVLSGDDAADGWLSERADRLRDFRDSGLLPERLASYAHMWSRHAEQVVAMVNGEPDLRERTIGPFLDIDLASSRSGQETWMLATHPLRLRWLGRDLHEMRGHLVAALEGRLALNPENSNLFFSWLERVSPHRQPPMLCSSDRTYLPSQEVGLHEQYVRTEVHRSTVGEAMDAKTATEITGIVETYLEAFPAKVDRFVLLLLTQAGDSRLIDQVIRRLLTDRNTSNPDQSLELHIVAPIEHHRRLTAAIAASPVESASSRLFPRLRVLLHPWPSDGLPDLDNLSADVDIAVVPEVLGSSATLNDSTGPPIPGSQIFDPWLDKPVNVPISSRHRTKVTIELLPEIADRPLEHWSTLNVRRRRAPVGGDASDVDRVTLSVDVDKGLELFGKLHDIAQWVVTVDEFVGREQIDAIENPPDVILVRPGRGKNELYTLVVSSRAGREFVEGGLRRKLSRLDLNLSPQQVQLLSQRLYDLAKNTAPSVVLKAIGLGRTLEEILGLVTTRVLTEQAIESAPGVGADWWISLDDHTDWFPELARAIDGVSRRKFAPGQLPGFTTIGNPDEQALDELRSDLRAGRYELAIRGVACSVAVGAQGSLRTSESDGIFVIHAPRETANAVLVGLAGESGIPTFAGMATPTRVPLDQRDRKSRSVPTSGEDQPGSTATPAPSNPGPVDVPAIVSAREQSRMTEGDLRLKLQTVVDKLDELRVPVKIPDVAPFDEGPGFYLLRVVPGHGVKVQQVEQRREDLELALQLEMDQAIRTYTHRGALVIEVPKSDEQRYGVDALDIWERTPIEQDRLVVPVGADIAGQVVSLDLSSPDCPHLLVAGMTGAGKSVALETLLKGAARYSPASLRILAVDPKQTELAFLEDGPHLLGSVGLNADDAVDLLERATAEMETRYAIMAKQRISKLEEYNQANPDAILPWWIIVLDEYADLAIDADDRKRIEPKMLRLAQKARAAGIHIILATQRPSADILNTSVRANFSAQLALRVRSTTDSMIILGETGAEALAGKGDALLRTAAGVTRLQCARVGTS